MAIEPESKADLDKLGQALHRLEEEEPCVRIHREDGTGETILTAMGDAHVDVIVDRLKRKFGAAVQTRRRRASPTARRSARRRASTTSTSARPAATASTGTSSSSSLRPRWAPASQFGDKIVGGVVPKQYIPAVEKGLREAMAEGVLAGYPVVDLQATLVDGSYHTVDSSEMAFKVAASQALKKAFDAASPALLEPILEVDIVVPDEYMGDVMGQITCKRGHVLGMDSVDGMQHLKAQVPQAEMFHYATELRSITQGRGRFSWQIDHYAEVPHNDRRQGRRRGRRQRPSGGASRPLTRGPWLARSAPVIGLLAGMRYRLTTRISLPGGRRRGLNPSRYGPGLAGGALPLHRPAVDDALREVGQQRHDGRQSGHEDRRGSPRRPRSASAR